MAAPAKYILVADDHGLIRYGVMHLIKDMLPAYTVLEAESLKDTFEIISNKKLDLLILDIDLPGGNNTNMLDVLNLKQPGLKTLIFSGYDELLYAVRYLQAGAKGYLNKQNQHTELSIAINTVLKGDIYLSQTVKDKLINQAIAKPNANGNPIHKLSNRELEVAKLLIAGKSISEISHTLNLQLSTVSTYKNRILEKLDVPNMVQLIEVFRLYFNYT